MTEEMAKIFPEVFHLNEPFASPKLFEESIESFFKVFNASPGGMCLTENSIILEINTTYIQMFGFSREEAIGQSNFNLGTVNSQELQRITGIFTLKGKLVNEEMTGCNKNGETVHSLVTSMPLELAGRHLILTSFNDITHIKKQNNIIAGQHKDILDSVHYSKRIQEALFPSKTFIKEILPQSFIFLKPKSIITGDFYWLEKSGDAIYVAAVDCTGNGVPGALLSIIAYNMISKIDLDNGETKPCEILNKISREVYKTLKQHSNNEGVKDGMDISVIRLNQKTLSMDYAGARQAVYRVRGNELLKLIPDRFPIGIHAGHHLQEFNNQQIKLEKGDALYLFTDGYSDQFGGVKKKKLKNLQFQKLLLSMQHLPVEEQKNLLEKKFEEWKGPFEQVDDLLVIGIKI